MAIYACEKATQLGAKVVTMSDSNGYVYDPNGIDLAYVKDLKEVRRGRIKEYAETHEGVTPSGAETSSRANCHSISYRLHLIIMAT